MRQMVWGLLAVGLMSTTALAQEPLQGNSLALQVRAAARAMAPAALTASAAQAPAAAPEPKKVTVLVGADMPTLTGYVFRGIVQEYDPEFTFQPYLDIGVAVSDKVTVNLGTWNSFHTGSNSEAYDGSFYETDFYMSATFIAGKWKPGVLYTLYASPAGGYEGVGTDGSIGVNELAFFTSYDDSARSTPLNPKFVVAFELTDTQADFGENKGIYFEAGIRPTLKTSADSKVTYAIPVKLGLSAKDYYETYDANGDVDNNGFGYLQFGASASVPLSFMTKGAWEFHLGMDFYVFGDGRQVQQEGDDEPSSFKPVLNFGFSGTF